MADSTHTLEIELRTKDFATASLKRVGEAGKEAGDEVAKGVQSADASTKSFGQRWLKLDGDFKSVAKVGVMSMNAISAGITTANADSENMGRSLLSAATNIASGFATGGPVGGALAATAAAVGLIANQFGQADREAKTLAMSIDKEMAPAIQRLMGAGAGPVERAIAESRRAAREMQANRRAIEGEDKAKVLRELELKDAILEVNQALEERRAALTGAQEAVTRAQLTGGDVEAAQAQLTLAEAAVKRAEDARRAAEDLRKIEGDRVSLAEQYARIEQQAKDMQQEQLALAAQQKALDASRKQAANAVLEDLVRQANEIVRTSKLTEDQLKVDKLVQMSEQLRLRGYSDLAKEIEKIIRGEWMQIMQKKNLNEAEAQRKKYLEDATDAIEKSNKELGFFADQAKKADQHLKSAASTNLAAPIKAATDELKNANAEMLRAAKARAPGRGGAQFDEEGNFVGLGLAEARQERRAALRTRKRRRAEAGRMGVPIGASVNLRSGRRAGGLGAFSAWQGGGGDMGVSEQPPPQEMVQVSLESLEDPFLQQLRAKKKATAGLVQAPGADLSVLQGQTEAARKMAEQAKVMGEESKKTAQATDEAKVATTDAAQAAQATADAMRGVGENLGSVTVALKDLQESANETKRQVERLLEAARLRGGN